MNALVFLFLSSLISTHAFGSEFKQQTNENVRIAQEFEIFSQREYGDIFLDGNIQDLTFRLWQVFNGEEKTFQIAYQNARSMTRIKEKMEIDSLQKIILQTLEIQAWKDVLENLECTVSLKREIYTLLGEEFYFLIKSRICENQNYIKETEETKWEITIANRIESYWEESKFEHGMYGTCSHWKNKITGYTLNGVQLPWEVSTSILTPPNPS